MVHSEHFSAFLPFYFSISKKNYDVVFALHSSSGAKQQTETSLTK